MNRSKARWLLVSIAIALWALLVYSAYYVIHKPFSTATVQAVAATVADLLTWLAITVVATALGSRMTRRLPYHSLLEQLTFSAGLGLAVFSLLTLGLGLAGLLYRWVFWVLLVVGGLLLWREFRELGRAMRQTAWPRPKGIWNVSLSLFVAAMLLLALAITVLPPIEWDSLVYHLVGPDRYLQAHRLTTDLDNYYLFFPSFVEMLFTAGMALRGDVVPRLLHFSYLLLTLGALGAFATRFWRSRSRLLAIALFISIPTAVLIATWSYVDLALTFYNFAALYAILNWQAEASSNQSHPEEAGRPATGWLAMAGLFAGASLSIKYTGIVTLLVLGAVLSWSMFRRRLTVRRFLISASAVGGLALVVAAPWYARNLLVTGNPLYPLLWGGRGWNEIATRWMLVSGREMSLLDLLIVPWTLVVMGQQGTPLFDATYSPLFLLLLPLLLVVRRKAQGVGELLLAVGVGYIFWIASGAASYGTFVLSGRQILPIFAPLSLLCAYSLEGLSIWDQPSFSIRRVLTAVTGLTFVLVFVGQILLTISFNPLPYLVGYRSRDDYLDQWVSHGLHQAFRFLNENLAPNDKVLFFWELRSYGLEIPHEADIPLDNFAQLLAKYGSSEEIAEALRKEGFTHILVNENVYGAVDAEYPITPEERTGWEAFRKRYLTDRELVYADGDDLQVFRLVP